MDAIKNRLLKNFDKISKWAMRNQIEAFRVYDRDLPDFPFILDYYKDHWVIYDKSNDFIARDQEHLKIFISLVNEFFKPQNRLFIKSRKRQEGLNQYEKMDEAKFEITVQEGKGQFIVNLSDYLDTGLFLDHRPLRYQIYKKSKGKEVLNLFCYTGAFSVLAALGGAKTTSIDMSKNYIEWAQRNFTLNHLPLESHTFICNDLFKELPMLQKTYDFIVLDPPTFSNSKKMFDDFEVERDQVTLVNSCMRLLKSDGTLYFSNNKRKFKIDTSLVEKYHVKNITEATIPVDFHDQKIHHCFEIKHS